MYKESLDRFLIFIILPITNLVNSGVDFVAIGIPKELKTEFTSMQQYVANHLKKNFSLSSSSLNNLHITLKEIGDLNNREREAVKNVLEKIAVDLRPYDIKNALKRGKLLINSEGLVRLKLYQDSWLTKLAQTIDQSLKELKKHGDIRNLKKRIDFPYDGHITLGYIRYKNQPLDKSKTPKEMLRQIQKNFKNKFNQSFVIDRFVLMKSNRPATPRIYTIKSTFYFSPIIVSGQELQILSQSLYNLSSH